MLQMYNFIMGMKFYFSALCLCLFFLSSPLENGDIAVSLFYNVHLYTRVYLHTLSMFSSITYGYCILLFIRV